MKKLKVLTIVGTRPEIIRLSCVIKKFDLFFHHTLVHTGQNYDYELNEIFFHDLGIRKPDFFLDAAGENSSQTIGKVIIKIDEVLDQISPDAVLVLGDTNSCLSIIPAKKRKIPTFHMEAGNRCFDQRTPEEINRKIVDHIADVNLTYSDISRQYLLDEGLPKDLIIKTGSPLFEVIESFKVKIYNSKILEKLKIQKRQYFLISFHREENINNNKNFSSFIEIINNLASTFGLPIIISTHPRTQRKINESDHKIHDNINILKPMGFFDYNNLQLNAKIVLSDSGTINEESSILNFPAINLRDSHERPEAMEEAVVMMTGLNNDRILQSIAILEEQLREDNRTIKLVQDYSYNNVSDKVLRIVMSYCDFVKRNVWKEY